MGYSESSSLGNQTPSDPAYRSAFANTGGVKAPKGVTRYTRGEHNSMYGAGTPGAHDPHTTTPGFPGRGSSYKGVSSPTVYGAAEAATPYGSQSGPGILESWFNQRAAGTDPAYDYSMKRGMQSLGNQSAAAGNFNSGAARQQESDFAANMGAQRLGQLDALAGGASGEHQNRLNSMFQQGLGIANGQAGLSTAYDLGAAGNMAAASQAQQQMFLNKAGVDSQFNQGRANNLINMYAAYQSGGKAGGGGGGY